MPRKKRPTDKAELAVQFINNLTHTKGAFARQPFNLRPWQESIVRELFKTDPATGLRQYRTMLCMLPRKNGKSELAAAIALYMLLGDGEAGAEVYSAAADRDQAALVFNVAAQMVRNDPHLSKLCDVHDSTKRIIHRPSGSVYRAISAEAGTKHGFNASCVIYDELHSAPDRELWDVLATSMGARTQPLLIAISTAGYDRHSICWEQYSYARKVKDGIVQDPTFLPVLYEAAENADWTDEQVWHAANPALGDFRSLEEMRIAFRRAKEVPAQENAFRRLYLNQWTEQADRWISMDSWNGCRQNFQPEDLLGQDCFGGLDLASTRDIAAFALLFPQLDGRVFVLPHFWAPADTIAKRSKEDRVPYDLWAKQGFLTATPGSVISYAQIRKDINDLKQKYAIREIGFDQWNAESMSQDLMADGLSLLKIPQTISYLNEPTKKLGDMVVSRQLVHNGNPVLSWMASNMVVKQDPNGNLRPDKGKASEKIDGIVAVIIALATFLKQPVPGQSVYETEELLILDF